MSSQAFRPSGRAMALALTLALASLCARGTDAQGSPAPSAFSDDLSAPQGPEMLRIASPDLTSPDGARQLLHKIRMASVAVCAGQGDDPVYPTGGYFGCVRRTTADAVARVGDPRLTALYGARADAQLAASR